MKLYVYAGLILLGAGLVAGSYYIGRSHERYIGSTKVAEAILKANENRGGINAEVESASSHSLCISLGGLPDQCEQLRGLGENKP